MQAFPTKVDMISIVVPVLNEEDAIPQFVEKLYDTVSAIENIELEVIFVDDGSTDETETSIKAAHGERPEIQLVQFTRNFGKEAALTAGLETARGDAVICMDVDLQDPPELIVEFVQRWREGYDVVLGLRVDRGSDSFLKRNTAEMFYATFNAISAVPIRPNAGDYRLMSRRVVTDVLTLDERNRFMKGIFSWVGYKTYEVEFSRPPRESGVSRFSGWKLWNFALEGITSFSSVPLRVWSYIGLGVAFIAFIYTIILVVRTLILGIDVPGYASLMSVVLFLGGIQLITLGVIGEYLGRIYMETKKRPLYLVKQRFGGLDTEANVTELTVDDPRRDAASGGKGA